MLAALDFYTFDVFNIFHASATYKLPLSETNRLKLSAQFTDERSVGDELLDAPPFQTQVWSVQVSAGFHDAIIRAAFSSTSAEARVRNPYGGYPGFISLMKSNFNRAGEQAWMLGLSYDLSRLGLKGVSMITKFASGFEAEDEAQRPDQQEFDITFDYYPPEGRLFSGFWLRVRGAVQFQDGKEDAYDLRVLLNYSYNIK